MLSVLLSKRIGENGKFRRNNIVLDSNDWENVTELKNVDKKYNYYIFKLHGTEMIFRERK